MNATGLSRRQRVAEALSRFECGEVPEQAISMLVDHRALDLSETQLMIASTCVSVHPPGRVIAPAAVNFELGDLLMLEPHAIAQSIRECLADLDRLSLCYGADAREAISILTKMRN